MEQQKKMFETMDDATKKELESVADNVFGKISGAINKGTKGDDVDKAVHKVILRLLEKARQTIIESAAINKM